MSNAREIGQLAAQHILKDIHLDVPKTPKKREPIKFVLLKIIIALIVCLFIFFMIVFGIALDVWNNPEPASFDYSPFIVICACIGIGGIGVGKLCSKQ